MGSRYQKNSESVLGQIRRYKSLRLKESFSQFHMCSSACAELSFILRHGYSKFPKNLKSLVFHDTLFALTILAETSSISAAHTLIQSAESVFPKQKRALPLKEYKKAVVSCKRKLKQNHEEKGAVDLIPQELLLHIFTFLDLHSLVSSSAVCRSWNEASNDSQLWKSLYSAYFHKVVYKELPSSDEEDNNDSIDDDWRFKFQQKKDMLKYGAYGRIFKSKRGYCWSCSSIVWLNRVKCSSELDVEDKSNHRIWPLTMDQVSNRIKIISSVPA